MKLPSILLPLVGSLFFAVPDARAEALSIAIPEIQAHNNDTTVDPALDAALIKKLQKTPLPYKGYRLIQKHAVQIAQDEDKTLQLSEGYSLALKATKEGAALKLDVSIFRKEKKVFGPLSLVPERSPTLLGPVKLKDGDMLLAIIATQ
jgi:hypothetical protein